ncbi:hypothetical protein CEUSTIGMA_g240.t1 [Chlamydomonas eustigma]|uniref:Uncharacterized protein n=1 Tax=Chlamydomonas eustigma TaxID=1157962 RepID=A0A250WPL0_9CHLO|nr:hypothetical protein CEUSTIGMA_g240.t1 [Chlamydomonas eustigma]|eukprot:GAX72784.1 hypothetical protein CEUSTIGMA_g240.t1 [Chlamydomonas eustigma]
MTDSYAQLALKNSANRGNPHFQTSGKENGGSQGIAELEEKVLSLAKLLRSCQMCQEDSAADHRHEVFQLANKVTQIESTMQKLAASAHLGLGPSIHSVRALADRLVLVEQNLMEGFTENQRVHVHNAEVVKQLEERLKVLEHGCSAKFKNQSAQLHEALQPAIMNDVNQRLDSFEREVQTRLLIATAGGPRQHIHEAELSSFVSPARQTSSQAQLEHRLKQFEDLVQKTISELTQSSKAKQSSTESDVSTLIEKMVDEALLSAKEKLEETFKRETKELSAQWQRQTVTRSEMRHVQHQLQVVSETHASMQLAVSQLQTVCPELSRLLVVMKGASQDGKSVNKQAQAASLLLQHTDKLIQVLSNQLEVAAALASGSNRELQEGVRSPTEELPESLTRQPALQNPALLQRDGVQNLLQTERARNTNALSPKGKGDLVRAGTTRNNIGSVVLSASQEGDPSDSLQLRSHLCNILEETRNSLDTLATGLKQHTTSVLQIKPSQQHFAAGSRGKENGGLRDWAAEREGCNMEEKVPLQPKKCNIPQNENRGAEKSRTKSEEATASAEKRHQRLRGMYKDLVHLRS